MSSPDRRELNDLMTLTMIPGLGPVLIARALGALGSAAGVLSAHPEQLRTIRGFGPERVGLIGTHRDAAARAAAVELARAADLGLTLVSRGDTAYPPLLAEAPDAPPVLYVRGSLHPHGPDRYPVAIVGSRDCTQYGLEQAGRFATALAQAGLTVVSGGARGIDSSAHRAALRAGGRTFAVLGSGVDVPYPPENAEFFAQIAREGGAVISELPLGTVPSPDNFPSRNRIIAALSLGVVVIEAGRRSGALITARLAVEDLGREAFALPGRVDSRMSEGALDLLKAGGAHLVTEPADVLSHLQEPARHLFGGTHADRFLPPVLPKPAGPTERGDLRTAGLSPSQQAVLAALGAPLTLDELCREVKMDPAALRADLTVLELRKAVGREGSRIARRE